MTESDSEIEGYVSSDGQSDFDEADTRPSEVNLGPTPSTSSGSAGMARPAVAVMASDSDDESAHVSDSSTDEVSVYS